MTSPPRPHPHAHTRGHARRLFDALFAFATCSIVAAANDALKACRVLHHPAR